MESFPEPVIDLNSPQKASNSGNNDSPDLEGKFHSKFEMPNEIEMPSKGLKTVILGDVGVGKTSITYHLMGKTFTPNVQATLGCSFFVYHHKIEELPNRSLIFLMHDTAGQERFFCVAPLYMRDADIVLFVYDRSRKESFMSLVAKWLPQEHTINFNRRRIIVVIENKIDLPPNPELSIEASKYCQANGYIHWSTSCLNAFGISELFDVLAAKIIAKKDDPSSKSLPDITIIDDPPKKSSCC